MRLLIRWSRHDQVAEPEFAPVRLEIFLEHFAQIEDSLESWRVAYPIAEVLLLVTCGTIANCDDFETIIARGEHHLAFCADSGCGGGIHRVNHKPESPPTPHAREFAPIT